MPLLSFLLGWLLAQPMLLCFGNWRVCSLCLNGSNATWPLMHFSRSKTERLLIWLYAVADCGWNWNEACLVWQSGKSAKQAGTGSLLWHCLHCLHCLPALTAQPTAAQVKHLTFISIWPQWSCEPCNETESSGEAVQLKNCVLGWRRESTCEPRLKCVCDLCVRRGQQNTFNLPLRIST